MSIPLPTVNLAGVAINQTGIVSFANIGISAGGVSANPANIQNAGTVLIYNESGSGLMITFQTSQSGFYLPAGAWQPIPIMAGETGYKWSVVYNLPNPPVTLLLTTYYYPGEKIPSQPTLGNSPIGIGGTIATSSVQTLSNETNSSVTLVIDIGQVGHTLLITINSDGSASWSVLQSGIAHSVFNIQTSGNPLQLGAATDTTEILGKLKIDGDTTFDGFLFGPNAIVMDATGQDTLLAASGVNNVLHVKSGGTGGTDNATFDQNGIHLSRGSINLLTGSISRISLFVGTGTGTYNHGLGTTPDFVIPICTANGSQTMGYDTVTSTQVHITCGAGLSFAAIAIKF